MKKHLLLENVSKVVCFLLVVDVLLPTKLMLSLPLKLMLCKQKLCNFHVTTNIQNFVKLLNMHC
jgi:hypothetical protein